MDINPPCQPLDLSNNEYCGVVLCPQCQVLTLRIGPVSLKLPPQAFEAVCDAVQRAAEKLPAHLACEAGAVPGCQDTRH